MDAIYPCVCEGECLPDEQGLGRCIMRASEPDSYCHWCNDAIHNKDDRRYYMKEYRTRKRG